MSIREKLAAFLFGSKSNNEPAAPLEQTSQPVEESRSSAVPMAFFNASAIELDSNHPIYQLYDLRRKESGHLLRPRLLLDEAGELDEQVALREVKRARGFVTSVCAARLKEINAQKRPKSKKKSQEDLDLEDEEEPLDALPCFFLSADKLYAWVLILPPAYGGEEITRDEIYHGMLMEDITFGVDEQLLDRISHDERKYFSLFLIARGEPAFDGKNGNIVEHFPREVVRVLEVDEYNQVDYTALNLIYNVDEGQEICRLILPTEGEPGRTVQDEEIPAKEGKPAPLPKGRNTEISEDGLSLVASIAGHVEYNGASFQVKPVLDIAGDVDFSTGDIKFLGDVNIGGDVLSGFSVQAMGNIHVNGALEAGCSVEAGGDLVVVKGILGDGETVVRSQRSVFSKYIENATIQARETLQTDCIINGNIFCDGEVLVKSGRGTVMGGRVWAAKRVAANIMGAPSECRNQVILGGKPYTSFERELLEREIQNLNEELERLDTQPESRVRTSLIQKAQARLSVAMLKQKHLEEEAAVPADPYAIDTGRLECGIAYAGTEVRYEDQVVRLRHDTRQCMVTVINRELVLM